MLPSPVSLQSDSPYKQNHNSVTDYIKQKALIMKQKLREKTVTAKTGSMDERWRCGGGASVMRWRCFSYAVEDLGFRE
ncbi:hypothetical protein HanXRQr2_Chr17g0801301 [Helianthus annuus]|uniref:Uncharacterized protein n=1 Tax=Helianthus annuus TaxID=4232 RepID=A0A9K3GU40_HELAN|nr:hypothetical protein HanXRQr2_Chr17g0801301 [Helianthus annuus]KAJ0813038.1 hypothetical protein HanPSC8_Chr17g0768911 [Helianthus annuus]